MSDAVCGRAVPLARLAINMCNDATTAPILLLRGRRANLLLLLLLRLRGIFPVAGNRVLLAAAQLQLAPLDRVQAAGGGGRGRRRAVVAARQLPVPVLPARQRSGRRVRTEVPRRSPPSSRGQYETVFVAI